MAMTAYGNVERYVARMLDGFPILRTAIRKGYQRLNYAFYRRPGFRSWTHPLATIHTQPACTGVVHDCNTRVHAFGGYYDVTPWSADMRYSITYRWTGDAFCDIVLYDRGDATVRVIARSRAWNFQQGSRAQWLPASKPTLVFNDIVGGRLVARIVALDAEERICSFPVQSVAPDGQVATSINYRRLALLRPEYGYDAEVDNFAADFDASMDGVWLVDLMTGHGQLAVRLSDLIDCQPRIEMQGADHKVNHVMYSPDGTYVVFMHRWTGRQGKFSRLFVADSNGDNLRLLLDARLVSHYSWCTDRELIVWARAEHGDRYHLLNVETGALRVIGNNVFNSYGDGHPSYSPDRRWIVTDTYPDRARQQRLLLFDTLEQELIEVARFFAPWAFDGPMRCDLHPRWSPDGQLISIDSAHDGMRRSYCIDVSSVLAEYG